MPTSIQTATQPPSQPTATSQPLSQPASEPASAPPSRPAGRPVGHREQASGGQPAGHAVAQSEPASQPASQPEADQLSSLISHSFKGIPKFCCWPSGFVEAWGTNAKKPRIFKKRVVCWPCRRRRQGRRNMIFLVLLTVVPQASKTPLGQKGTSGSV